MQRRRSDGKLIGPVQAAAIEECEHFARHTSMGLSDVARALRMKPESVASLLRRTDRAAIAARLSAREDRCGEVRRGRIAS